MSSAFNREELLGLVDLRSPPPPETATTPVEVDSPAEPVATLIFADECCWHATTGVLQEGQRLIPGRLHLERGLAAVRCDSGTEAMLAGEVKLQLMSQGSVRLLHGRITLKVPEEAIGFTVQTPSGDVVDLGTEFAVDVEKKGATEIRVLAGTVEHRQPSDPPGSGQVVRSGQAVRYEAGAAGLPRPVAMKAEPFEALLRQANPRPRPDRIWTYEGFDYPVGEMATEAASDGAGWADPWRLRRGVEISRYENDDSTGLHIAFQRMTVPWAVLGGRAGMLEMPPGNTYRVRSMARPLDLGKDAIYYVSLLVREEPAPVNVSSAAREESVRLTFRSSEDDWGDRVALAVPGQRKPRIETAHFLRFTASHPVADGQTMLWVAKIVARSGSDDAVFFRVYQEGDALDVVEPADWSVVTRGVRSNAKLDLVLLTSTGQSRRWFDELRVGTSWRAAVPIGREVKVGLAHEDAATSSSDR